MRLLLALLVVASVSACKPDPGSLDGANVAGASELRSIVGRAATESGCAGYVWRDRGVGAQPFFVGMGIAYAKALCQPQTPLTRALESAPGPASGDVLTFLSGRAAALETGSSNRPTLARLFTAATGLAQMESNGRYCVGRDQSADFTEADSAEAGIFQTSWGAHVASPILKSLFQAYQSDPSGCELALFQSPKPRCSSGDAEIFGSGTGAEWQALTKSCPMFSIEYGLVVMRKSGGGSGEFGPVRKDKVEFVQQCTNFYVKVEEAIANDPSLCSYFR